jgi:hypothetical protein
MAALGNCCHAKLRTPPDAKCRRRRADVDAELRALVAALEAPACPTTQASANFLAAYACFGVDIHASAYHASASAPTTTTTTAIAAAAAMPPPTTTTAVGASVLFTTTTHKARPARHHQLDDAGVPQHILARRLRDRRARALRAMRAEAERARERERMTPIPAIVVSTAAFAPMPAL